MAQWFKNKNKRDMLVYFALRVYGTMTPPRGEKPPVVRHQARHTHPTREGVTMALGCSHRHPLP